MQRKRSSVYKEDPFPILSNRLSSQSLPRSLYVMDLLRVLNWESDAATKLDIRHGPSSITHFRTAISCEYLGARAQKFMEWNSKRLEQEYDLLEVEYRHLVGFRLSVEECHRQLLERRLADESRLADKERQLIIKEYEYISIAFIGRYPEEVRQRREEIRQCREEIRRCLKEGLDYHEFLSVKLVNIPSSIKFTNPNNSADSDRIIASLEKYIRRLAQMLQNVKDILFSKAFLFSWTFMRKLEFLQFSKSSST